MICKASLFCSNIVSFSSETFMSCSIRKTLFFSLSLSAGAAYCLEESFFLYEKKIEEKSLKIIITFLTYMLPTGEANDPVAVPGGYNRKVHKVQRKKHEKTARQTIPLLFLGLK
jgi:hypothetical protein